jgi:hypothetical protein
MAFWMVNGIVFYTSSQGVLGQCCEFRDDQRVERPIHESIGPIKDTGMCGE